MKAIASVFTLLLGVVVILAGNGLLGTLLGVRGDLEGFSTSTLGLIMAGYFAGFVIGTQWVPGLVRKIGHIRAFATLASVASVTVLLHGLYVAPLPWLVLRIVSGICIVGLYIVIESWLGERSSNENRGHVFAAYMTTTLIGLGIGQLLLMAGDERQLELFALASVLLSLGLVPVAMTDVHEPAIVQAERLGLRKLFRVSPLGLVGCAFAGVGSGTFWGLGPVFASEAGFDSQGIAAFMGMTILGGIAMLWPVGRLSDRRPRRAMLAVVCAVASLGATLTAVVTPWGSAWVMIGGFVYGSCAFSIYSLAAAHTNDHFSGADVLEVTSSLQLVWAIGAIAGPILGGLLMHGFGASSLMMFIAVSALAPAVYARRRMAVGEPLSLAAQREFVPQFATSPAALEMHPDAEVEPEAVPATRDSRWHRRAWSRVRNGSGRGARR